MHFGESDSRRHRSCESDSWPFCADPVLFETRRAVGQAVRTTLDFLPGDAVPSEVLKYIAAAKAIEGTLHDKVLPELVAEARAKGVAWEAIGKTLGIGDTGAQRRFGNKSNPGRGDLPQMEDQVVNLTNQLLTSLPEDSPELAILRDELGETTPRERMKYAIELMRGAQKSYKAVEDELALAPAERGEEKFISALFAAHQKIMTLTTTIVADPEQWAAIPEWAEQPGSPDTSHYDAPVAYIFYAMRLVMLACNYNMRALSPGLEFTERILFFRTAREVLETSMMVMMRRDVTPVINAAMREN